MKYRAIFITEEKLPRPYQDFSDNIIHLRDWARAILRNHKGVVKIYEVTEKEIETIENNSLP